MAGAMDHTSRPLTKRPRASLACNACRQTKSKCDGNRPTCERCARNRTGCVYTQSGRDKRIERQEERKANLALAARVKELEARLAALLAPAASPDLDRPDPRLGSFSDAGSRATGRAQSTAESSADAIATGLFENPPALNIGYFGPSSNHAFFWSLSASIANIIHRSACRYQEPPSRQGPAGAAPSTDDAARPTAAVEAPSTAMGAGPSAARRGDDDGFPTRRDAMAWVARFFDTVGAVLPYVDQAVVLKEVDKIDADGRGWQAVCRSTQALLSIIFAQALYTLEQRSPEPFYRRALGLLNEETIYSPSVEALQALLLLASFQQNTQRSMESWPPHYLAVRVAYQLGIHAPASYEYPVSRDKEIHLRLWFAVVNQDRILTAGLARPSLIPLQHVNNELIEYLELPHPERTTDAAPPKESMVYFRRLISLHEILGLTVDAIYSSNINSSHRLAVGELVSKVFDLSGKLQQWRDSVASPSIVPPDVDPGTWTGPDFDAERFSILLEIFHWRAAMLQHGSLLMRVLEQVTSIGQEASSDSMQDTALFLLKNYLKTIRKWLCLIKSILQQRRYFLNCNAVWWTSNYMMLSACIHSFSFWLLSENVKSSVDVLGMHSTEIEALLRETFDTMMVLGGTSIIIHKAHRCLQRYMGYLKGLQMSNTAGLSADTTTGAQSALPAAIGSDDLGSRDHGAGQGADAGPAAMPATTSLHLQWADHGGGGPAGDGPSTGFGTGVVASCIDDMFGSLSQDGLLHASFLGLEQGISDFDTAGFI